MKKLKVYAYKNCGTSQKALKFLEEHKIPFDLVPIRETPPTVNELKEMLKYQKHIKKLLNSCSKDYKDLKLKDKLSLMSEEEILNLLNKNGNLIKRPFVLGDNFGIVGFKQEEWKDKILGRGGFEPPKA